MLYFFRGADIMINEFPSGRFGGGGARTLILIPIKTVWSVLFYKHVLNKVYYFLLFYSFQTADHSSCIFLPSRPPPLRLCTGNRICGPATAGCCVVLCLWSDCVEVSRSPIPTSSSSSSSSMLIEALEVWEFKARHQKRNQTRRVNMCLLQPGQRRRFKRAARLINQNNFQMRWGAGGSDAALTFNTTS